MSLLRLVETGLRTFWFWFSFPIFTFFYFLKVCIERSIALILGVRGIRLTMMAHRNSSLWGKTFFWINPGWTYQIEGLENLPKKNEGAVIVANHSSGVDICALFATNIQFRWLSKDDIFKIPMMGDRKSVV